MDIIVIIWRKARPKFSMAGGWFIKLQTTKFSERTIKGILSRPKTLLVVVKDF